VLFTVVIVVFVVVAAAAAGVVMIVTDFTSWHNAIGPLQQRKLNG